MKSIQNIISTVGFIGILLFATPVMQSAHAQQFSFALKPAQNHVIAKPGSSVILPYTLTNTGDPTVIKLQPYILSVKDSSGSYELIPYHSDVPGFPQFITSDASIKIGEPFLISAQEAIEFDLNIVTTEDMDEGDYYFTFVVESEPTEGFEDTSHIIMQSGIGSNIYLSITKDGTIKSSGEITQFNVQPQYTFQLGQRQIALFDSFQPVPIVLTVANKGNRLLQSSGNISVRSSSTSEIVVIPIAEQFILANSQRLLTGSAMNDIHTTEATTAIVPGSFIGAFTAEAHLQIGADPQQNSSIQYYVFPFRYTLFIFVLLIVLIAAPRILQTLKK